MNLFLVNTIIFSLFLNFGFSLNAYPLSKEEAEELSQKMLVKLKEYYKDIMEIAYSKDPQKIEPLKKLSRHVANKGGWPDFLTKCVENKLFTKASTSGQIAHLPYPYFHAAQFIDKFETNFEKITVKQNEINTEEYIFIINDWKIAIKYIKNEVFLKGFHTPDLPSLFLKQPV